jgi:hypothetical protein
MRKEKALIDLLRGIVNLLAEESARNPDFANKLDGLLSDLPERRKPSSKKPVKIPPEQLPDIHAEWNARGETDFRLWLREQSVPVLHAILRAQGLDPTRRAAKWKEAEKLADFITEGFRARQSRGSAFIGKDNSN